ncbi:MAG: SsrA-binding protein SmpB [Candidatus Pacebacteria bacterium]|nr:SsrA-binding protein SmpB [Candidatus Paceibacterota bacterium]
MRKGKKSFMKVFNRRAKYDYYLLEKFEAGIVLTGAEVKSVRENKIKLAESFVRLREDGAYLVNAHISPYRYARNQSYQPTRSRRLLLHKKQILSLMKKMEGRGLALVPYSCYLKRNKIKLGIALARGKKKWDKREAVKKRDLKREAERELRAYES